jgi:hypothetical protein
MPKRIHVLLAGTVVAHGKLLDTAETNEPFTKTDIVNPAARTILAASRHAYPEGSAPKKVIMLKHGSGKGSLKPRTASPRIRRPR